MSSLTQTTHTSTITLGEIIDMSDRVIQTSNGDAWITKVVCDTGDIVSIWRNDEDPELPALKNAKDWRRDRHVTRHQDLSRPRYRQDGSQSIRQAHQASSGSSVHRSSGG